MRSGWGRATWSSNGEHLALDLVARRASLPSRAARRRQRLGDLPADLHQRDRARSAAPGRPWRRPCREAVEHAVGGADDLLAAEQDRAVGDDGLAAAGRWRPWRSATCPNRIRRSARCARRGAMCERQARRPASWSGGEGQIRRRRAAASSRAPPGRIADVAQAVGQQVDADDQRDQRNARRDGADRGGVDGALRFLQQAAPRGVGRRRAEAEIGERGFGNDREAELQREIDRQRRPDVGQDMLDDDARPRGARGARRR